jgi:hypothetical protein
MPALNLAPALTGHDDLYERLVRMHEGLSEGDSLKLWAKFALLLANHIGDPAVITDAIAIARPR